MVLGAPGCWPLLCHFPHTIPHSVGPEQLSKPFHKASLRTPGLDSNRVQMMRHDVCMMHLWSMYDART
jgi:hypothetical protein